MADGEWSRDREWSLSMHQCSGGLQRISIDSWTIKSQLYMHHDAYTMHRTYNGTQWFSEFDGISCTVAFRERETFPWVGDHGTDDEVEECIVILYYTDANLAGLALLLLLLLLPSSRAFELLWHLRKSLAELSFDNATRRSVFLNNNNISLLLHPLLVSNRFEHFIVGVEEINVIHKVSSIARSEHYSWMCLICILTTSKVHEYVPQPAQFTYNVHYLPCVLTLGRVRQTGNSPWREGHCFHSFKCRRQHIP